MKTQYELIVVGGGFAGTAAAIEAARHGTDVLLIEKYNCLGGAAAYALVSPFMGYWTHIGEERKRQNLTGDLVLEIVDEAMKLTARSEDTPMIRDALFDEESMKLAMIRVENALNTHYPEAKLLLQVHDELIVECPERMATEVASLVSREMTQVAALSVPLQADAKWGRSWYEAK